MAASNPEAAAYANSMMRVQLENQELRDKLRDLSTQLSEYKAAEALAKRRRKTAKSRASAGTVPDANADTDDGLPNFEKSPSVLGKGFTILHELFPPDILSIFSPGVLIKPKLAWNSPDRYPVLKGADYTRYQEGLLADLYHHVPEAMYDTMRSATIFAKPFKKGVEDERSLAASRVRSLASTIYGLDGTIFVRGAGVVSHPELNKRLKWDLTKKKYSKLPPILHLNLVNNRAGLLFNNALVLILKVILQGPASITPTTDRTGRSPPTSSVIWGVRKSTPGMIACAAVLAVYGCSPDANFSPVGSALTGKFDYRDLHLRIKRLLITMADTPWAKRVMAHFDAELFGGKQVQPPSNDLQPDSDNNSDNDEKLMQELAAVTDDVDVENGSDGSGDEGEDDDSHAQAPPESVVGSEGDAAPRSDMEIEYFEPREIAGVPMSQDRAMIRGTLPRHLVLVVSSDSESSESAHDDPVVVDTAPASRPVHRQASGSGAAVKNATALSHPILSSTAPSPIQRKSSGSGATAAKQAAGTAPSPTVATTTTSSLPASSSDASRVTRARSGSAEPSVANATKAKPLPRPAGGKKKGKQPIQKAVEEDEDMIVIEEEPEEEPEPEPAPAKKKRTSTRSKVTKKVFWYNGYYFYARELSIGLPKGSNLGQAKH
ncbi:hypothetical protein C8Q80DRAFT_1283985 [Daedaleopsis nitida]|nr:hypothetical protein C8Q80DRAFT_1283985 [Daedaleopsis nitida]